APVVAVGRNSIGDASEPITDGSDLAGAEELAAHARAKDEAHQRVEVGKLATPVIRSAARDPAAERLGTAHSCARQRPDVTIVERFGVTRSAGDALQGRAMED